MQVEEIKRKVTFELLSTYVQSVQQCASLEELIAPTKRMFKQVAAMVFPKVRVEYVSLEMPQDVLNQEESKSQLSSEQKLVSLIRKLQRQIKVQTEETDQVLLKLQQKRDISVTFMKEMVEQKCVEQLSKTFIDGLNQQIQLYEKKTNHIKSQETDLMSKFEKLFDEATVLMTQAEIIKESKLSSRLTNPYKPITQVQDRVFPYQDALKYENQLVSIIDAGASYPEFNFDFSNGVVSQFKSNYKMKENCLQPAGVAVKKIVLWYEDSNAHLYAIQLFAKDGTKLLQTGYSTNGGKSQETVLEDDERIIGYKGRAINSTYASYFDFQFVIGRMA